MNHTTGANCQMRGNSHRCAELEKAVRNNSQVPEHRRLQLNNFIQKLDFDVLWFRKRRA